MRDEIYTSLSSLYILQQPYRAKIADVFEAGRGDASIHARQTGKSYPQLEETRVVVYVVYPVLLPSLEECNSKFFQTD